MKVKVGLTVDGDLIERAKKEKINLSQLLEQVLQTGYQMNSQDFKDQAEFETLYRKYEEYRLNISKYRREAAMHWVEAAAPHLFMSKQNQIELLEKLEFAYFAHCENQKKMANSITAMTGNDDEKIERIYEVYKKVEEKHPFSDREKDNWIAYRKKLFKIAVPVSKIRWKLEKRFEDEKQERFKNYYNKRGRGDLNAELTY